MMIRELIYIIEILTVLKCIHCVYGEKQKIGVGYVLTVAALFVTMMLTNMYSAVGEGSFMMHCILAIYSILTFKRSAKEYVINTVLYMIVMTITQLVIGAVVTSFFEGDVLVRTLLADLSTFLVCFGLFPSFKFNKLAKWASSKNVILYASLGYIFLIICYLLITIRVNGGIHIGVYLNLIPFILFVYILSKQWKNYQDSYEREKKELQLYKDDKKKLDGFISEVRSRQHEINNHITAIMSLHYTADTYEDLVRSQKEYCKHLHSDNKFNCLLRLYNSVLPGFLVDKFTEIEQKGIVVECEIIVDIYEPCIPEYYLIEMLGIMIDNAVEAVIESGGEPNIYFAIHQVQSGYEYIVRNPFRTVTYGEIESWFEYENSTKGTNRGIGLYHLKHLCEEWKCTITYQNIEKNHRNWIEFMVRTDRNL